jgi:hypothetical protein
MTMKTKMTPEQRAAHYRALKAQLVTEEEKARWAPMMRNTWQAIGGDVEQSMESHRLTKAIIVECVLDANRVQMYGGMTDEEYEFVCALYGNKKFDTWCKSVLNY